MTQFTWCIAIHCTYLRTVGAFVIFFLLTHAGFICALYISVGKTLASHVTCTAHIFACTLYTCMCTSVYACQGVQCSCMCRCGTSNGCVGVH